ncbi:LOW QUALITY PROTEIN: protein phosphatase 2C-like domain-containing protein 1 [Ammospiza maritima maritima]
MALLQRASALRAQQQVHRLRGGSAPLHGVDGDGVSAAIRAGVPGQCGSSRAGFGLPAAVTATPFPRLLLGRANVTSKEHIWNNTLAAMDHLISPPEHRLLVILRVTYLYMPLFQFLSFGACQWVCTSGADSETRVEEAQVGADDPACAAQLTSPADGGDWSKELQWKNWRCRARGKPQALPGGQAEKLVLIGVRSLQYPKFYTAKSSETHRQKVHYLLEFLVDNPTPTPFCDLANINNPGTSNKVNESLIKAFLICDKNSTWQRDMEDRFIVLDNHESRSDTCFLEIHDGCHGVTATETIVAKLPLLFLEQLSHIDSSHKNKTDKEQILEFFARLIKADYRKKEKNQAMRRPRPVYCESNEVSKVHWSGGSAGKRIPREEMDGTREEERKHPENNTHSPLARTAKGVAGLLHIAITEHSTSNVEKTLQNGGNISTNKPVVEGYLRTTRALGHHRAPAKRMRVISVLHTASVPINVTCQFLILTSNGLGVLDYLKYSHQLLTSTHYLRMHECCSTKEDTVCQYLETNDHKNQPNPELSLFSNNEVNSKNRDTLNENALKIDKTMPSNSDSNTQLAEKMDSNSFCDTAGDVGQELLKTASPLGSKPPPQFEKDTKTYQINCKSQAAEDRVSSETLQCNKSPCEQLAKTALAPGSRDNITILIILLNGCDKIPNYLNI